MEKFRPSELDLGINVLPESLLIAFVCYSHCLKINFYLVIFFSYNLKAHPLLME